MDLRDGRRRAVVLHLADGVVTERARVRDAGQPIDPRVGREREHRDARTDEPDQGVQPDLTDREGRADEHRVRDGADGDRDEHGEHELGVRVRLLDLQDDDRAGEGCGEQRHSDIETETDDGQPDEGHGDGQEGHQGSRDSEPGDEARLDVLHAQKLP